MKTENKLFTVAGTAAQNGVTKVRFANDKVARFKILDKNQCTDIDLVELPEPMTKLDALRYLATLPEFQSGDAGYAVQAKMTEKSKVAKKGEVKVSAKSVKTGKTTVSATTADTVSA